MPDIPDDILFDKRLIERHLRQGLITHEDLRKRLEAAENVEDLGDTLDLDQLDNEVGTARRIAPKPSS